MKIEKINTFTIAHYILLFFVVVFCMGIVAWTLARSEKSVAGTDNENVIFVTEDVSPCVQQVTNQVSQMWAYSPDLIPDKYLHIADEYANQRITEKTRGECNNVKFTCRRGDVRRDCDPCALPSARHIAMNQQIADMTRHVCGEK